MSDKTLARRERPWRGADDPGEGCLPSWVKPKKKLKIFNFLNDSGNSKTFLSANICKNDEGGAAEERGGVKNSFILKWPDFFSNRPLMVDRKPLNNSIFGPCYI